METDTVSLRDYIDQRIADLDRRIEPPLSPRNSALSSRLDRSEGRGSGLNAGWGYVVAGIGALGGLLGIAGVLYAVLSK